MRGHASTPTFRQVQTEFRVRYAETDRMGVAHHAAHLVWFETGRTEYCRAAGFTYADMERDARVFLMVADVHCRYHRGVTYDDLLRLATEAVRVTSRLVQFHYRLTTGDGDLVAEGETMHLPVSAEGGRTAIPQPFLGQLRSFARPAETGP